MKQREIKTLEELAALPEGAILVDRGGVALQRQHRLYGGWTCINGARDIRPDDLIDEGAPLILLWEPSEERDA